jgi:hypothetical protein
MHGFGVFYLCRLERNSSQSVLHNCCTMAWLGAPYRLQHSLIVPRPQLDTHHF